MSNKRVLLICYYFPPLGGAGVGRPLALYKHLHQFGWECHVLTVKPVAYRLFEPELLDDLSRDNIYRAGSFDPQRLMYLMGIRKVKGSLIARSKAASNKFFPDSKVGWVRSAVNLGKTLLENRNYDAIISTSPPVSVHLVAQELNRVFAIPWIADFRDYWTAYPIEKTFQNDSDKIKKGFNLLDSIKKQASTITAINPSVRNYVKADHVIYNSFDVDLAKLWESPDKENYYIGILGSVNDLCPIEPLFQVISKLRAENPDLYKLIKLVQVGLVDKNWLLLQLEKYNLTDKIEINGLQKRSDTVKLLSKASLMYLGLQPEEKGITPGRIYNLLSSGRPILAYAHLEGELAKLINLTDNGLIFDYENPDRAVSFLRKQIELFKDKIEVSNPLPDYSRPYASDKMAAKFAEVLKQL